MAQGGSSSSGGAGAPFVPYDSSCPLWDGPWDVVSMAGRTVLEDEMFVTGRCESVEVRFGVLMFDMVLVAFAAFFALTVYARALVGGGLAKWNMRMTILTLATLGPWLRLILLFLGMFYKLNAAYHILLSLPFCCTFAALTGVIAQWLIVIAATNKLSHSAVLKQRLYKLWLCGNVVCSVVLTVLWGAASAFRYGDQQNVAVLNWLFAAGFLFLSLQGVALGVFVQLTGRTLLKQLQNAVSAHASGDARSSLSDTVKRIRMFMMITTSNAYGGGSTCLGIFIWFLATRNSAFGMGGFFFVLLLGLTPLEVAGVFLVFFVYRRPSKPVSDADSGSTSEPQKHKQASANAFSTIGTTDSQTMNMGSVAD